MTKDKFHYITKLAWKCHRKKARTFSEEAARTLWHQSLARKYPLLEFSDVLAELMTSNDVFKKEGNGFYSLGHLSYQEYLAAHAAVFAGDVSYLADNIFDPWWQEVVLFFVGISGDATRLLSKVVRSTGFPDHEFIERIRNEATYTLTSTDVFLSQRQVDAD